MGLGWPLAVAVNFGGVQVMHIQKGFTNSRPVYRSEGDLDYFTVTSNGANWIAVRYVSGSPTAPQVGPLDTTESSDRLNLKLSQLGYSNLRLVSE